MSNAHTMYCGFITFFMEAVKIYELEEKPVQTLFTCMCPIPMIARVMRAMGGMVSIQLMAAQLTPG